MPIQTVVASLVLIYLRDEIDVIHARINKLIELNEQYDNELTSEKIAIELHRPRPRPQPRSILQSNEDIDNDLIALCDTSTRIIEQEIQYKLHADAYNNLLTLVKMDSDPNYPAPVNHESILVYNRYW